MRGACWRTRKSGRSISTTSASGGRSGRRSLRSEFFIVVLTLTAPLVLFLDNSFVIYLNPPPKKLSLCYYDLLSWLSRSRAHLHKTPLSFQNLVLVYLTQIHSFLIILCVPAINKPPKCILRRHTTDCAMDQPRHLLGSIVLLFVATKPGLD